MSLGNTERELVWKLTRIIEELLKALPPSQRSGGFNVVIDEWDMERRMTSGPGGLPVRTIVREDRMSMKTEVRVFLVSDFAMWEEKQKRSQETPRRYFELD